MSLINFRSVYNANSQAMYHLPTTIGNNESCGHRACKQGYRLKGGMVMRFKSKKHMAKKLLNGKWYRYNANGIIHYDESKQHPFRYEKGELNYLWNQFGKDVWEEVEPGSENWELKPHICIMSNIKGVLNG